MNDGTVTVADEGIKKSKIWRPNHTRIATKTTRTTGKSQSRGRYWLSVDFR
jgi:hypothetical protein